MAAAGTLGRRCRPCSDLLLPASHPSVHPHYIYPSRIGPGLLCVPRFSILVPWVLGFWFSCCPRPRPRHCCDIPAPRISPFNSITISRVSQPSAPSQVPGSLARRIAARRWTCAGRGPNPKACLRFRFRFRLRPDRPVPFHPAVRCVLVHMVPTPRCPLSPRVSRLDGGRNSSRSPVHTLLVSCAAPLAPSLPPFAWSMAGSRSITYARPHHASMLNAPSHPSTPHVLIAA